MEHIEELAEKEGLDGPNDINMHVELEMSQNFKHLIEPKFCLCVPLAKGICCGFVSLKFTLILIALLDVTMGLASIFVGFVYIKSDSLNALLAITILVNIISCILAIIIIFVVIKQY